MMKYRRTVTGLSIAALAACTPAMVVNPADEEAAVRARSAAYLAAFQARNLELITGFLTPDAVLAFPNSPLLTGPAQVRTSVAEFLAAQNLSTTWSPARITVAGSGDLATEMGTYELGFDGPAGRVTDRGNYTTAWRKVGADWMIASDFVTSSVPMPTPPEVNVSVTIDTSTAHEMLGAGDLNWQPFSPPGFPPGGSIAVVHGNPQGTGDYALRLRFPDGHRVPVHWHGMAEHVTVLAGEFNFAMSGAADAPTHPHGAGDFLYIPAHVPHQGFMRGETILQLHGIGPFTVNLGMP
jgi:ketosteroid isomerase-like protein